ncbi:ABC-2 type transport system ATP-binding protein/lipopolysaccharide transport system ATP-binding protein [Melghirimyces profundicolus]|uniref:ABC-2 type transport system ATP-binding protein/lipopolysaccharide transport system ATP-binding protein n=1 Tax=Melghirimyces profundicolus TaxID=1242148 RepID=A0A2T6B3J4_9BACL|nr:ABC transporter ATP-binding protein [Melghirimyces profundicolus]PTX50640.1 ABC-2 type transport system ATP-binding protein/lipopolysaccharide transport system ATP-binding protein [Melghirimyces profundicolus]
MEAIVVDKLTKHFRRAYDKTLKGFFISLVKGEKRYKEFTALNNVSFKVNKGESYAIIGKNGAGKSTLFKVLSGIIHPDSGSVKINGKVAPLIELGAGLSRDLTGAENIRLNCAIFGLDRKRIEEVYPKIVEFSELEEFIHTPVKFYSSGMKARLGFSIAIHIDADIILIDEVLAVGDKDFKKKCYAKMEEIRDSGKTLVIVSHSLKPLRKICDRALILERGQVVDIGEINEMIDKYQDEKKTNNKKKKGA